MEVEGEILYLEHPIQLVRWKNTRVGFWMSVEQRFGSNWGHKWRLLQVSIFFSYSDLKGVETSGSSDWSFLVWVKMGNFMCPVLRYNITNQMSCMTQNKQTINLMWLWVKRLFTWLVSSFFTAFDLRICHVFWNNANGFY